jgi:hypothetical protein
VIRLCAVSSLVLFMLFPCSASAQAPDDSNNPVHVGDQWTYDTKDEITDTVSRTYTATVSEITPKEISTHLTFRGRNGTTLVVFDHEWNRIKNGNFEYKPHDANGVQFPLVVGKEWHLQFFTSNTKTGANFKTTDLSKVVAQETVTTAAGTFDVFRIERQVTEFNTADPSRSIEAQVTLLYAPQINHWVRRTILTKLQKRLRSQETDELVEVSLKR